METRILVWEHEIDIKLPCCTPEIYMLLTNATSVKTHFLKKINIISDKSCALTYEKSTHFCGLPLQNP